MIIIRGTEPLAQWTEIAALVVQRGLRRYVYRPDIISADRLAQVVRGYSAATVRRHIGLSMREEVGSMWVGLTVDVDLRDDSTVGNIIEQVARRAAEWFGE